MMRNGIRTRESCLIDKEELLKGLKMIPPNEGHVLSDQMYLFIDQYNGKLMYLKVQHYNISSHWKRKF
jgi:hypothetical protein